MRFTPLADRGQIDLFISQVIEEYDGKRKGSDYIIKGLMIRIMDVLVNLYDIQLSKMERQRKDQLLFQEMERYILSHYKEIKIDDLVSNSR